MTTSLRSFGAGELFVSPEGSDRNTGAFQKPFATFERARDAVRALKRRGQVPPGGFRIWIRGGTFIRTHALELDPADSGLPNAPTLWAAYNQETPRWVGGRALTGFSPVTDGPALWRLSPEARAHVVSVNLRELGITNFGELKSRGFDRPVTSAHSELFYGGSPMTLARWPNEGGWARIYGFPAASGHDDQHGGQIGALTNGFFYNESPARPWVDRSDVWVHGYWAWDWANSYERVESFDPVTRFVATAPPHGVYGFRPGQRFYFLNILEELDSPGEWFLDKKSGELYFWPPDSEAQDVPEPETLISLLGQPMIKLSGASWITIRGLRLEATRGNGIEEHSCSNVVVSECIIKNIGNYGVIVNGGRSNGVVDCDIFDTGDGGVMLNGGDRQTLTPSGHYVDDCHFARQGRWSKCYMPAVLINGVGMRVSHCLIHDHPHCAIHFAGNDHLIEFNEIHHVALETGDVGAIYSGRDYTFRGNVIRNNFIHHTGGVGMGSMGVYMDDCISGALIEGNVFYKVQRAAFLGGGRDHRVINNVFVECDHAVELDGRGLDRSPVWRDMITTYMRDRLSEVPLELYRKRYPAMEELDAYFGPPEGPALAGDQFKGIPPGGNVVERNICVGKWLNLYWNANSTHLQLSHNLTGVDPRFAAQIGDASPVEDFALKTDSPAWAMGFRAIPVTEIGLRSNWRQTLDARRRRVGTEEE